MKLQTTNSGIWAKLVEDKKERTDIIMKEKKSFVEIIKRVLLYFDNKYDMLQKDEIIQGDNKNLDTSYYKRTDFHWEQMREVRLGLEKGLDVSSYAKKEFNIEQMEEIRLGLEKELDVSYYNKPNFHWKQMREIRLGLDKGLDVSAYAKEELSIEQMEEIKLGLEKGLDVSYYNKPNFTWEQMREIRIGLQRGLDVSTYAKESLSIEQMEKMRIKLQKENPTVNIINKVEKTPIKKKESEVKKEQINNKQVSVEGVEDKENTKDKDFKFSRYDANVIFPVVKRTQTKEGIEERLSQIYHDKNEASRQINIFKGRINKLVSHGYMEEHNGKYDITMKGAKAAKEVNTEFEFTSYDANEVFGYINNANGFLSLDNLRNQLEKKYTNYEDVEKQFTYIKNRLENNFDCGYVTKNDKGAYSISEIGAMKAEEINSSLEVHQEIQEEIEF